MSTTTRTNGRTATREIEHEEHAPDLLSQVIQATRSTRDIEVMAKRAAASRMYGMDENQAFTLMMICEAEGLHPIEALRRYHIIQGRPALRAEVVLADMMRLGWEVAWTSDPSDATRQEATFRHRKRCPEGKTVAFTIEEAKRAGVTGKDNWKNWPAAMLRARVNTIACRMLDPGIIAGTYSVEEIEDMDVRPGSSQAPVESSASPLRQALDATARGPVEPPAATPKTDFGQWVELKALEAWGAFRDAAKAAGVDPGKPITRYQVGNHLIGSWIDQGMVQEDEILTDGKRDKNKVALQLSTAWEADAEDVRAEVEDYLREKVRAMAKQAGIAVPGVTDAEATATEPDAPPDGGDVQGDLWEPGRE